MTWTCWPSGSKRQRKIAMGEDLLTIRLKAMADPTRRAILDDLYDNGPQRAGDIATLFPGISRPGISKHLRVLREAGLIAEQDTGDGRTRVYQIEAEALRIVQQWVARYVVFWEDRLDALERLTNDQTEDT